MTNSAKIMPALDSGAYDVVSRLAAGALGDASALVGTAISESVAGMIADIAMPDLSGILGAAEIVGKVFPEGLAVGAIGATSDIGPLLGTLTDFGLSPLLDAKVLDSITSGLLTPALEIGQGLSVPMEFGSLLTEMHTGGGLSVPMNISSMFESMKLEGLLPSPIGISLAQSALAEGVLKQGAIASALSAIASGELLPDPFAEMRTSIAAAIQSNELQDAALRAAMRETVESASLGFVTEAKAALSQLDFLPSSSSLAAALAAEQRRIDSGLLSHATEGFEPLTASPLVPESLEVQRYEVLERAESVVFAPRMRKRELLAQLVAHAERAEARDLAAQAERATNRNRDLFLLLVGMFGAFALERLYQLIVLLAT